MKKSIILLFSTFSFLFSHTFADNKLSQTDQLQTLENIKPKISDEFLKDFLLEAHKQKVNPIDFALKQFSSDLAEYLISLQDEINNNTIGAIATTNIELQSSPIIVYSTSFVWDYFNGVYSLITYYPNNMMIITNATGQYCYRNNTLFCSSKTWKDEIINGIEYIVFYYSDGEIYTSTMQQYIYKY